MSLRGHPKGQGPDDQPGGAPAPGTTCQDLPPVGLVTRMRPTRRVAASKRRDPAGLGLPRHAAFRRAVVDGCDTWTADPVRLVESPLDRVKRAVCLGLVPMSATVERHIRLARELERLPELGRALDQGMSLEHIELVARIREPLVRAPWCPARGGCEARTRRGMTCLGCPGTSAGDGLRIILV